MRHHISFADLDPPATDEEARTFPTAAIILKRRRQKAAEARRAACGLHGLWQLAYYGPVGASLLLSRYTSTPQVSPTIARINFYTGAKFSSRKELSVIDGAPVGVRVTLTSNATRGTPPARNPDVTFDVAK